MSDPIAWILNFDAEMEMADPAGYRPSKRMLANCERLEQFLLPSMERGLGSEPRLLVRSGSAGPAPDIAGAKGLAWAPTPSAIEWMRRKGVEPLAHPDFDVLCRINHRSFLALFQGSLDKDRFCLPGETFVRDIAQLELHLASFGTEQSWLLKRPFGFAGRARKELSGGSLQGGRLHGAARTWVEVSMSAYGCGLQVEPKVDVQAEFGLHAWLGQEGEVLLGDLQLQVVDPGGAFVEARPCGGDRSLDWIACAMEEALTSLTLRAAREGYFGPMGLDAFLWKDARGVSRLRVASDLNARFSMAWFQGMENQLRERQPWLG